MIELQDAEYIELREFLDRLPGGFPATESGVELKILRKMFTPEEARLTVQLRMFPEPASVIAKRWGTSEAQAADKLAGMAVRGCITSVPSSKEVYYQASQFFMGVYEFHRDSLDRELSELMLDYEDNMHDMAFAQTRIVPIASSLDATSKVADYNRIRSIVKKQKTAAVMPCICRVQQATLGRECEKPLETCLAFGVGASHTVNTGKAHEISIAEALEIIDRAEENGLVLLPTNARDIVSVCCCCSCCCLVLRALKTYDRPADHVNSACRASIDPDRCISCGTCLERCPMDALEEAGSMRVDPARCIGCGLCVSTCPERAISLVSRENVEPIPANYLSMLSRMAKNRGVGFGKLDVVTRFAKVSLIPKMLPGMYRTGLAGPIVERMARRGWV
ncbi:MAG: 4Fe-4S binding protein [Actinobacteria bacterium]|nr:4Fe-4S binding protein [Actinomycetota bacterium]